MLAGIAWAAMAREIYLHVCSHSKKVSDTQAAAATTASNGTSITSKSKIASITASKDRQTAPAIRQRKALGQSTLLR